jgi:hypothetical protein
MIEPSPVCLKPGEISGLDCPLILVGSILTGGNGEFSDKEKSIRAASPMIINVPTREPYYKYMLE